MTKNVSSAKQFQLPYSRGRTKMRITAALAIMLFSAACANVPSYKDVSSKPTGGGEAIALAGSDYIPLSSFAHKRSKMRVAVYDFPDFTGKNDKNKNFAEISKAVSQGADAFVVSALRDVGDGSWFKVLERRFLEPVLQERRIQVGQQADARQRRHTQAERRRIQLEKENVETEIAGLKAQIEIDYGLNSPRVQNTAANLPPLEQTLANLENYRGELLKKIEPEIPFSPFSKNASVGNLQIAKYIVTGAIIGYDHDVVSGGAGLRLLNLGFQEERRKDIITINLRFVDTSTSEILSEQTVTQVVESSVGQGSALNYVTHNTVLEFEAGHVVNEPRSFALEAAIRLALSRVIAELQAKKIM